MPFAVDFGSGPEAREEGHANALTRRCFLLWLLLTTDGGSVSVLTLHEFCTGTIDKPTDFSPLDLSRFFSLI